MPLFRRRKHTVVDKVDDLSSSDRVWNRAALERGGSNPREGDAALAALLSIHNIAMNGGLLHSIEHHTDEQLARGIEGYEYFGLSEAATVLAWAREQAATLDLDADLEAAERLELDADQRYGHAIPDDSTITRRFEEHFAQLPDRYAP